MKWRRFGCVLLLCGFPALSYCASFSGYRRLEALPGDTWLSAPSARLRLAAGAPVAFTPCSQAWMEGSWRFGSACFLWAMAGQTRVGAYRENDLGWGLRAGGESLAVQARVHRQHRRVDGIASENSTRGELALVLKESWFSFGLQQDFPLGRGLVELPSTVSCAFRFTEEFWSASLMREDSPYAAHGEWSAGLQLTLASISLACRGDEEGGNLQLGLFRAPWNLRLSVPVVSSIDAGPYLGLEFGWKQEGGPR